MSLWSLQSEDVAAIERFFDQHQLMSAIELSAWAPATTITVLRDRSYRPEWFRSMYAVDVARPFDADHEHCRIEPVTERALGVWLEVLAVGNGGQDAARRQVSDELALATHAMPGTTDFIAIVGTEVVGCGSVQMAGGVAWLGPAATLPPWRQQGIQRGLLEHRLRFLAELDCSIAAATAVPNGPSARNSKRVGFRHVQTQVVVSRPMP